MLGHGCLGRTLEQAHDERFEEIKADLDRAEGASPEGSKAIDWTQVWRLPAYRIRARITVSRILASASGVGFWLATRV